MTPEGRYPSERSGTRSPSLDNPLDIVLAEIRSMRAENARLEGRVSAEIVASEKRLRHVADGSSRRDVEATQFDMGRTISKLRKELTVAALAASIAVAGLVTRWVVGSDVAEASEDIATAAIDAKADELHEAIDTAASVTADNSKRIDVLESKIDRIIVALDQLNEPAPVVVPAKKKGAR